MKTRYVLLICQLSLVQMPATAQTNSHEKQLLKLIEDFFAVLEKQDTAGFRAMFTENGYIYAIREISRDSAVLRTLAPHAFRFQPGQILKERMRKQTTSVKIEGRIGMVWAPYDLWVNDTFSHCGVDVFTTIRTSGGWKIASIAYTVETEGCD